MPEDRQEIEHSHADVPLHTQWASWKGTDEEPKRYIVIGHTVQANAERTPWVQYLPLYEVADKPYDRPLSEFFDMVGESEVKVQRMTRIL